MMFWIFAVVMLVVALLFVVPPLMRKALPAAVDDRRGQNIVIAREKLTELESEFKAGRLDEELYKQSREELEMGLHEDLIAAKETSVDVKPKRAMGGLVLAGVFVPAMSLAMYMSLGSPELTDASAIKAQQAAARAKEGKATQTDVNEMVSTLRQKLEEQPDNLTGWMMLGRSYIVMQRFDDAVYSYEKAYGLDAENPEVLLPLADALAMSKQGQLKGRPLDLVNKALEVAPDNSMALWLAGMGASQSGDTEGTIKHWTQLETLLPADSEDRVEVQRMLRELGADVEVAETSGASQADADSSEAISVAVTLSEEFKSKASPDDLVFVYAKAVSGPPMPLAAVRKKVSDFPLNVVLDDSQAMMPQMKLSRFAEVTVGARVSKSGEPVAAPGDLFAEQSPVPLGESIQLEINSIVQ